MPIILIIISGISAFAIDKSTFIDTDGDVLWILVTLTNDGIPDVWEDLNHNVLHQEEDVDLLVITVFGDDVSSYLDTDNGGVFDSMESGVSLSLINPYDWN